MGCDIHIVVQKKVSNKWIDIPTPEQLEYRNYSVFGWLAGVRDGSTKPLQKYRGFPPDFKRVDDEYHIVSGPEDLVWMGDHNYGWLSASEILANTSSHINIQLFITTIKKLCSEHGQELRIVFGFDS